MQVFFKLFSNIFLFAPISAHYGKNGVSVQFPAIGPGQYFIEAVSGNKKMVKKIIK